MSIRPLRRCCVLLLYALPSYVVCAQDFPADTLTWNTYLAADSSFQFDYPDVFTLYDEHGNLNDCDFTIRLSYTILDSTEVDRGIWRVWGRGMEIVVLRSALDLEDVAEEEFFYHKEGAWFVGSLGGRIEAEQTQGSGWRGFRGAIHARVSTPTGSAVGDAFRKFAMVESDGACRLYFSLYDDLFEGEEAFDTMVESTVISR